MLVVCCAYPHHLQHDAAAQPCVFNACAAVRDHCVRRPAFPRSTQHHLLLMYVPHHLKSFLFNIPPVISDNNASRRRGHLQDGEDQRGLPEPQQELNVWLVEVLGGPHPSLDHDARWHKVLI